MRIRNIAHQLIAFTIQQLTNNQARTEAIWFGIEKTRVSAHRIEAHGTLMHTFMR
jgi:hypothetical protein